MQKFAFSDSYVVSPIGIQVCVMHSKYDPFIAILDQIYDFIELVNDEGHDADFL